MTLMTMPNVANKAFLAAPGTIWQPRTVQFVIGLVVGVLLYRAWYGKNPLVTGKGSGIDLDDKLSRDELIKVFTKGWEPTSEWKVDNSPN